MAYLVKIPFEKISIIPEEYSAVTFTRGKMYGFPDRRQAQEEFAVAPGNRAMIEKEIHVLLAGDIAEFLFTGHDNLEPVSLDAEQAKNLAELFHDSIDQVEGYLAEISHKTEEILQQWWHVIELLAEALLRKQEMTYAEVCELIARGVHEEITEAWQKMPP